MSVCSSNWVTIIDAWVLHKRWSGDTSAEVTFFTREKGLVQGLCKGGRTPKKQALLQAFTPLWVGFNAVRERHYVCQLEITATPLHLPGSTLFAGLYLNELLHHVLHAQDPYPELFDRYQSTLDALAQCPQPLVMEASLRRFEWTLLTECGYAMSLTHDAQTHLPIACEKRYQLLAGEGFIVAERGIQGEHILAFADGLLHEPAVLKAAKWIMRRAIDHALDGRALKSRALFS